MHPLGKAGHCWVRKAALPMLVGAIALRGQKQAEQALQAGLRVTLDGPAKECQDRGACTAWTPAEKCHLLAH